jgi:hypothetical protein
MKCSKINYHLANAGDECLSKIHKAPGVVDLINQLKEPIVKIRNELTNASVDMKPMNLLITFRFAMR